MGVTPHLATFGKAIGEGMPGGTFYLTADHDDADIDFTLEAFSRTMAKL